MSSSNEANMIVGLDIGTSKVVALVGEANKDGMVEIVFVGFNEQLMRTMPSKIMKESWREMPRSTKEPVDG